ncbi:MAG: PD-(D/E)XK nuclease family protein [Gemmatimonadetes bacterium]|nr:PD-(D/E)XK nuclease family protein [Gemmatimonadota bacterium]
MPASLLLLHGTDPRELLLHAADGFLAPPAPEDPAAFPSPRYLLALRQGGLREDLIRLAAERGHPGWLDPPLCTFQQLPEVLGATDRRPCDDFERSTILAMLIRRGSRGPLGRLRNPEAFVGAVDRLFGELLSEGITADACEAAVAPAAGKGEFEAARDTELAALYRDYLTLLQGEGRRDGRDRLLDVALAIADPARLTERLGGRREIRFAGLQDLRGGWRALLGALCRSSALDRIVIYSAEPLDLGPDLPATGQPLGSGHALATRLFTERQERVPGVVVQAIAAPDAERELEEVARRVRALADGGTPLHRIAVVARQARPYLDLALHALERFGVPATARRRVALVEVPAVRALRALLSAAADGWSRHGLVELAEQPYFASGLDAAVLNYAGYRQRVSGLDAWQAALTALAAESARSEAARERGDDEERRAGRPRAARARLAADGFARFAALAAPLDEPRSLGAWADWLVTFLEQDPWGVRERMMEVPAGRLDVVRLDLAAWRGLADAATRWREALARWGDTAPMTVDDFRRRAESLLDGDVALWTPSQDGVQVVEGLAAAYRPFEQVFLVGLTAGQWPLAAPRSPVFDESERAALTARGLPLESEATWDRLERGLFRVLVAGAERQLTVSWSQLDPGGADTVPSAYVEALGDVARMDGAAEGEEIPATRVVTPGARIYRGADALARARHAAPIEHGRQSKAVSPWNGGIEDPALLAWLARELGEQRQWSPTQLEALAKCPWSWFSSRLLHLERQDDPDEAMDHLTRGTLLHRILARFFERAAVQLGTPARLLPGHLTWALPLLAETVAAALTEAGDAGEWLGHPALLAAREGELTRLLTRYLTWEAEEHDAQVTSNRGNAPRRIRTGVVAHEVSFVDQVLEVGGLRVRIRGSVDRMERGVDERFAGGAYIAAVDYKTTAGSVPGAGKAPAWADAVVLQVPLYAWALARLHEGATVARVEYRSLKKPGSHHLLELAQYDRKAGAVVADPKHVARYQAALAAVARHVEGARAGRFPAAPAPSCGCPSFCHAIDICRVAGGPVQAGWP